MVMRVQDVLRASDVSSDALSEHPACAARYLPRIEEDGELRNVVVSTHRWIVLPEVNSASEGSGPRFYMNEGGDVFKALVEDSGVLRGFFGP